MPRYKTAENINWTTPSKCTHMNNVVYLNLVFIRFDISYFRENPAGKVFI